MIDFTKCKELLNDYGGSEKKKKLLYEGEVYLVKFPDPVRQKNNPLSYMNNQFSEYIGCHIFESVGIPVQETLLGTYSEPTGKEKVVVACKDFTTREHPLHEFSRIANSTTTMERKTKVHIEDVYQVIEANSLILNKQEIIDSFWNMFVIDTLISNPDRHLNNWGVLNSEEGPVFAPIYDCGSCLHALLDDECLKDLLADKNKMKNEAYNVYSAYSYGGKRINCAEFFKDPIPPLGDAVLRIVPRIDMQKIRDIIGNTPYMADIRKDFLIQSITVRKELILDRALKRCSKKSLDTLVKETAATQRELSQAPSKGFREIGPTR